MKAKKFFQEPTISKIMKYSSVRDISHNLVDHILSLDSNEAVIIYTDLVPNIYKNPRKFMKHAADVKIRRFTSLEKMIKSGKTPVQLRELAFNNIKPAYDNKRSRPYCSYSFKPFRGTDKRTRKIPLVECVRGTKLYCYSRTDIKSYHDAKKVAKDGAEVIVSVPSRTKKHPRYEFKFSSVPTVDNLEKWAIAFNISTDHNCKSKRFNMRYRYLEDKESSRVFNFCSHEIAAYLSIIDYFWNEEKNIIPLQMSQFAIPTQETVDYYTKLCNNCLIITSKDRKPRKLNLAEKEILLWNLVFKFKHDKAFFAKKEKKVKDYNWSI